MEKYRCNWCGLITEDWNWVQRKDNGIIVCKCDRCAIERKTIPLIPLIKEKDNEKQHAVSILDGTNRFGRKVGI